MAALKTHTNGKTADEVVLQALVDTAGSAEDNKVPPRPEGVHSQVENPPSFMEMMASLVDQVKKEVDESKSEDRYAEFLNGLTKHQGMVMELQVQLHVKLKELEKEESKKITSDQLHDGFNTSHVSKPDEVPVEEPKKKRSGKDKVQAVELLNPGAQSKDPKLAGEITSGSEADIEEGSIAKLEEESDDDDLELPEVGRRFSKIGADNYQRLLEFISKNPTVVQEQNTDGLLVEAFNSQLAGKADFARRCVHHALLLQYCRQLGRDGVGLFFKRYGVILSKRSQYSQHTNVCTIGSRLLPTKPAKCF
jgi:cell division cycle protein 37